ncbi:MAG: hypothetical protein ABJF04_09100 [Reichenbachiella sp.]|uniref:hypothetical protein n=1 Tax=Reichenbachiella sp. TaxID=2184521 RepID=UPI0032658FD8
MNRINFKQERDLGATLQDASTFIKQNFVKIMKPTLIVAIIPMLIGTFFMVTAMQTMYSDIGAMSDPLEMYSNMAGMVPAYFLIMIAYVIAYIMFIAYIKLYAAGQEDITLSDLTPILKSKALSLTFSWIALVILMYVGMFLCLIPGIYLGVVFAHFFVISIIEESGFGATWKRSFFLIKDNWWSSFGLYIVTYLIAIGIMIVVYIPTYSIMAMELFSAAKENDPAQMMNTMSTTMSYIMPFYYLIALVMMLLFAVVSSLRYYSLVEIKDGTGEKELIDQI